MKIAKRVLAVAMAIAMIACCAAMASAAIAKPTANFELVLAEAKKGVDVKLYANDCTGLAAADIVFTLDPAVVADSRVIKGDDANQIDDVHFENNSFTAEYNKETGTYGFYFKENLWATEKWAEEDLEGDATINGDKFHVATLKLTLVEGKTVEDVVVGITASGKFTDGTNEEAAASIKATGIEKKAEETTTQKVEETTAEAPSTPAEVTTEKGNTDKGPATGDTGVLAVAAGVVALAGAAFVATKKRK